MNKKPFELNTNLIKKAGFLDGFLKGAVEKIGFREKPFETIFSIVGTAVIWRINSLLGIVAFMAESLGYGPGLLGRAIDTYLKSGGAETVDNMNLNSESDLRSAAEFAISDLMKNTNISEKISSSEYFLNDLYNIKKSIDLDDIITASYVGKYFPLKKEAGPRTQTYKRFLMKILGGKTLGVANILYGIIKLFAVGIVGLGIAGGTKSVVKDVTEGKGLLKKPTNVPVGSQYYANKENNIEGTIIKFLNTIKFDSGDFETTFQKKYNMSMISSPQMDKVLMKIKMMNGGVSLDVINRWDAFFAPELKIMANMFMPGFIYEKNTKKTPKEELSKLLKGV
jgi:hypothetical protein